MLKPKSDEKTGIIGSYLDSTPLPTIKDRDTAQRSVDDIVNFTVKNIGK